MTGDGNGGQRSSAPSSPVIRPAHYWSGLALLGGFIQRSLQEDFHAADREERKGINDPLCLSLVTRTDQQRSSLIIVNIVRCRGAALLTNYYNSPPHHHQIGLSCPTPPPGLPSLLSVLVAVN